MTEFYPRACDCVVHVESSNILNITNKEGNRSPCRLHRNNPNVNDVYSHNLKWSNFYGDNPTFQQEKRIQQYAIEEKLRIRINDFVGDQILEQILKGEISTLETDLIPDVTQPQIGFWKKLLNKLLGG